MKIQRILKYIRYSGLIMSITFNPFHWQMPKYFRNGKDGWEPNYHSFSFLFLTIRFWIDDGSW
jgi:hypothetical protein